MPTCCKIDELTLEPLRRVGPSPRLRRHPYSKARFLFSMAGLVKVVHMESGEATAGMCRWSPFYAHAFISNMNITSPVLKPLWM